MGDVLSVTVKDEWEKLLSSVRHIRKKAFLKAFAECGTITKAAELAEIERHSHYFWCKEDKQYKEAFDIAREIYDAKELEVFEAELKKRALEPSAPMSSILLMFKLKSLADKYRDKLPEQKLIGDITIKLAIPERKYPELKEGDSSLQ